MRIIGGRFRGTRLAPFRGKTIRPLLDATRESVFNILADQVEQARVLDLFCGTGSFGLEAISRGAESCVFVEGGSYAFSILKANVEKLGVSNEASLVRGDVFGYFKRDEPLREAVHLIFMDPPYKMLVSAEGQKKLSTSFQHPSFRRLLHPDGLLLLHLEEGAPGVQLGSLFRQVDERKYGRSILHFLRPIPSDLGAGQGPPG